MFEINDANILNLLVRQSETVASVAASAAPTIWESEPRKLSEALSATSVAQSTQPDPAPEAVNLAEQISTADELKMLWTEAEALEHGDLIRQRLAKLAELRGWTLDSTKVAVEAESSTQLADSVTTMPPEYRHCNSCSNCSFMILYPGYDTYSCYPYCSKYQVSVGRQTVCDSYQTPVSNVGKLLLCEPNTQQHNLTDSGVAK